VQVASSSSDAKFLSAKEYAKHRHVSAARIYQLIKSGRIRIKDRLINVEEADASLDAKLDQSRAHRKRQLAMAAKDASRTAQDDSGAAEANAVGYWESKAKRERYEAAIAKLKYLEKLGSLVDLAEYSRSRFDTASRTATAFLQIPARMASILCPNDPGKARKLLTDEITRVLLELADDLENGVQKPAIEPEAEPIS
jgi:hypothetical protein